jgi:hypothetical protein
MSESEYQVQIPDEYYVAINFQRDGLPGVGVVNLALRDFEPKAVLSWHLSLIISCVDLIGNGKPSRSEVALLYEFGDKLDATFKGSDQEKPNALFLGRITWQFTRELLYRVFEPEPIDPTLKTIIDSKDHPRWFDYRISHDRDWKLAEWYLSPRSDA